MKKKFLQILNRFIGNPIQYLTLIFFGEGGKFSKSIFWSAVNTISTCVLLLFTYNQIKQVSYTNQGELINEFRPLFSDPNAMELYMLLDYELIEYKNNTYPPDTLAGLPKEFPCFVRKKMYPALNKFLIDSTKYMYTFNEVAKFLLNPISDLSLNVKWGAINVKDVYMAYGYYIIVVWENEQIQKYINWNSEHFGDEPDGTYENIRDLYNQINIYREESTNK